MPTSIKSRSIHCTGILVTDALSGPLAAYPVPRVRVQSVTQTVRFMAGGGAANTSGALGKMGLPAAAFSKVGDDPNGAFLIRELAQAGVDTSGIRVSAADSTPFTFVGIHPDGDRTFIHTPGANKTFCPADLDLERLFDCRYLLYQDLWVLPKLDGQPGADLLAEAQRRGVVTLLDECWGLGPNRDLYETMLPHCDYALPSLDDMRAIYPEQSPDAIADHILSLGAKTVVLKMGAEGCLVAQAKRGQTPISNSEIGLSPHFIRIPSVATKVVDTTGAGDCFNAGFLAGLWQDMDLESCARMGAACASFCIEAVGGTTGIPSLDKVRERAEKK
jgi:sugar/nucleoside kinase (ribokinase family)